MIPFGILFFKDDVTAKFAVSANVHCKSPEKVILAMLIFAVIFDWYGSYNGY